MEAGSLYWCHVGSAVPGAERKRTATLSGVRVIFLGAKMPGCSPGGTLGGGQAALCLSAGLSVSVYTPGSAPRAAPMGWAGP